MPAPRVKQVNFRDGIYLSDTVRQSVGTGGPTGSLYGVTQVEKIDLTNFGVSILMKERVFLIPWGSISSVEVYPEEEQVAPAPQDTKRK